VVVVMVMVVVILGRFGSVCSETLCQCMQGARSFLEKRFQNYQLLGGRDGCSKGIHLKLDAFLYLGRGFFQ